MTRRGPGFVRIHQAFMIRRDNKLGGVVHATYPFAHEAMVVVVFNGWPKVQLERLLRGAILICASGTKERCPNCGRAKVHVQRGAHEWADLSLSARTAHQNRCAVATFVSHVLNSTLIDIHRISTEEILRSKNCSIAKGVAAPRLVCFAACSP